MHTLYVGLGSNEGKRVATLRRALYQLSLAFGAPLDHSGVYLTAAWGETDQADFLNLVATYSSDRPPLEILHTLLRIEHSAGRRRRRKRWGPRTLDLDLLVYGPYQLDTPALQLPHPRLAERNFVLAPLAELHPDLLIPGYTETVRTLYTNSPDPLAVERLADSPAGLID